MFDKVYDNHTIFINCDCATVEQIAKSFDDALLNYRNQYDKKITSKFMINLIKGPGGESYGIGFVFISNPQVYNLILGKNPNGSDRIEYRPDPSWKPSDKLEKEVIDEPEFTQGKSWAEFMEEEEEYNRKVKEFENKDICPQIPVILEPLMKLVPMQLTKEQINERYDKIKKSKEDFNPNDVPDKVVFSIERAGVNQVEYKFMHNVLKCKRVHPDITSNDIKLLFTPYVSDSVTKYEKVVKGKKIVESYPFINSNNDGTFYIIFDPATTNAQFALHMTKKTILKKNNKDITIIFTHSYKTEKDVIFDNRKMVNIVKTVNKKYPKKYENNSRKQVEKVKTKSNNSFDLLLQ